MKPRLSPLLVSGYGAATLAASAMVAAGLPLWAGALIVWIGGALAVLVIAASALRRREAEIDRAALAAELAQWNTDLRDERIAASYEARRKA
jgi:TRAP-type C4-dicarboxylate transport system permease small subunit